VAETHAFDDAAVPDPVSWVVDPAQTLNVPVIVGKAFIVTVTVVRELLLQLVVVFRASA
jgi:hypothetical protein